MSGFENNDIIFTELPGKKGDIGQIMLNRPQALNALTASMCQALHAQLMQWQANSQIKAVIVRGEGPRAFCAGGDIRAIYEYGKKNPQSAINFFRYEYRMYRSIFHFTKPYVSFLHGITMGGGAGISMHGSHRIGDESLIFAMPETGIGFFPDVGGGFFLSRMRNKMGYYLGLTGDRIGVYDARWLGLVTHIISSDKESEIIESLINTEFTSDAKVSVSQILDNFSVNLTNERLSDHQQQINDCFSADSMEEILLRLEENNSEWSMSTAKKLLKKSPTSLKITFEQLKRAEKMSFDDIVQMEFNIALQFLHANDFFEGVRAAVIDKDQNPQWNPALLEEVTPERVEKFFSGKTIL